MIENDKLIGFFSKHLVPISITFQKNNDKKVLVVTAFILSVLNQWFLVTAGHWNNENSFIKSFLDNGYEIIKCYLIDSLGLNARYKEPVTFDLNSSQIKYFSHEPDFDYGIILLSKYYRKLLESNGIEALTKEVWKKQPANYDFYILLGIPSELVKPENDYAYLQIPTALCHIDRLEQKPEGFSNTDVPMFYGRIYLGENLNNIGGMSGGPILGFKTLENGQLRYWLVALQSTWLEDSKLIKGCYIKILGDYLESLLSAE